MRRPRTAALSVLVLAFWLAAGPARAAGERFEYRWSLRGFVGAIASVFVPGQGEGLLTVEPLGDGRERCELKVTSDESAADEYFLYGSEWLPAERRTVRAWSELEWRGEQKKKRAELDDDGVIDVAAAIQLLRRTPPRSSARLEIWSDGRLYPVVVLARETERRRLAGRQVEARRYSIHGISIPDRRFWKGQLDLWIADDPAATPVEIVVARKGARVKLELIEATTDTRPEGEQRR